MNLQTVRNAFLGFLPSWVLTDAERELLEYMREACDTRNNLDGVSNEQKTAERQAHDVDRCQH